jgi:hypothetical protein
MTLSQRTHRSRAALLGIVLAAVCLVSEAASATAQAKQPAPPPEPAFPKLFPKYTGANGYEDLVMAGDLLLANEALSEAEQSNATLKVMRKALEDPAVDKALQLVRAGLEKPIQSPRDPGKLDENTLLPEYAEFRRLGRLLGIQEYVYLADGQVGRAIDTMRDGLRLGYVVQGETLLSGLVGIAIDTIVLQRFADHFDQMSLRDCAHLTAVAQEWLKQPSRMEMVLTMEHHTLENMLGAWKDDPERLRKLVKDLQPTDEPKSDADLAAIELSRFVETNGPAIPAMLEQVRAIALSEDRAIILETRKPPWQRKPLKKQQTRATMATRLYGMVSPSYGQALSRFDAETARIHLLGVNGAIHRFRWENNRLPTSLAELNLPVLTTDPFTGSPLIYKVTADRYELSSAGPPGADGSGPIYLPRKAN